MGLKLMTQPWLWKRGVDIGVDAYVGLKDEPLIDYRNGKAVLRIMDGVTPGGVVLDDKITAGIARPAIQYPLDSAVDIVEDTAIESSRFIGITPSLVPDDHVATFWEIYTDAGLTNPVYLSGRNTFELTRMSLFGQNTRLANSTTHYVRVRYEGAVSGLSEWSAASAFTVKSTDATTEVADLRPTHPVAGSYFGSRLRISQDGNSLVTTALYESNGSIPEVGAVYYYRKHAVTGVWELIQTLFPPDVIEYLMYGDTYYLTDDFKTLVVGARTKWDSYIVNGRVYLYKLVNGLWVLDTTIHAPADHLPSAGTHFGYGVAISEDLNTLIIGSHGYDTPSPSNGSTYVYTRNPTTNVWSQSQILLPAGAGTGDNFGLQTDISNDGTVIVISALFMDDPVLGINIGGMYIYRFDGLDWIEEAYLVPSTAIAGDKACPIVRLSADGNTVYAGGHVIDGSKGGVGVFTYNSGTGSWSEQQMLSSPTPNTSDYFGLKFDVSDDDTVLAISAQSFDQPTTNTGAVYIFKKNSSTGLWSYSHRLSDSTPIGYENFGVGVAISNAGGTIAVGLYGVINEGVPSSGGIKIFE